MSADVSASAARENPPARRPSSRRSAPTGAPGGGSPTPARRIGGSIEPGAPCRCASKVVLQPALLGRHLGARIDVLGGAAAAEAEVTGSAARAAAEAALGHGRARARGRTWLAAQDRRLDPLARQRAVDEHHLAVGVARDAAALGVQRIDRDADRDAAFTAQASGSSSRRNSAQCGPSLLFR